MNNDFYSSTEFLNTVAGVTALVIFIAFLLGAHPFKFKKRLVVANQAEETKLWTARDYYMFLNSLIRASKSMQELKEIMPLIEGYYDKAFRVQISTGDRKNYYARLLSSYSKMEAELGKIKVELCKS